MGITSLKILIRLTCLLLLITACSISVFAQQWGGDQGAIENAQVIIEKSRDIVLPQASRNFEKVPPLPAEESTKVLQPYQFTDVRTNLPALAVKPRILKLKEETLEKLYKGYVKGGFGNYTSPYIEGYLYNKRDKDHLLGVHFVNRSYGQGPVDKSNSANGRTALDLSGNLYKGPVTLGADAGYEHTYWHFYGYPDGLDVKGDTIRQHFNRFHIHGYVQSTPKTPNSGFLLNVGYSNLADRYHNSESRVNGNLRFDVPIQQDLYFSLLADATFLARKDSVSSDRDLIKFRPTVFYRYQQLDVRGGLNTVIQNDTISSRGTVLLYPVINLQYHINKWLTGFLNLDGDMQEVSMHTVTSENPYLLENVPLYHTDKKFGLDWGIKANLNNLAYFKAGFSYANLRDMYYYLNDSLDMSRFRIVYDTGITDLTHIYGELNMSKPGQYLVNLTANYYNYQVGKIAEPWHRPSWKIDLITRYNIYRKILLSGDFYFMGGIKAKDFNTGNVLTLKPVSDLNFNIDYLFSERFSIFLDFRNILGNHYETYWRYPSRGTQFMAGASVNF